MSQEAVERLLGRLITDEQFRIEASSLLENACLHEGYRLTPDELRLLSSVKMQHFAELEDKISPSLRRAGR
jgi:hypothetical protein